MFSQFPLRLLILTSNRLFQLFAVYERANIFCFADNALAYAICVTYLRRQRLGCHFELFKLSIKGSGFLNNLRNCILFTSGFKKLFYGIITFAIYRLCVLLRSQTHLRHAMHKFNISRIQYTPKIFQRTIIVYTNK